MHSSCLAFEYQETPPAASSGSAGSTVSVCSPWQLNVQVWPAVASPRRSAAFVAAAPAATSGALRSAVKASAIPADVADVPESSAAAAAAAAVAVSSNAAAARDDAADRQPSGNTSDFDSDDPDFADLVSRMLMFYLSPMMNRPACRLHSAPMSWPSPSCTQRLHLKFLLLQSGVEPDWTLDRLRTMSRKVRHNSTWHTADTVKTASSKPVGNTADVALCCCGR